MRLPSPDPRQLRGLASSGWRTGRDLLTLVPRVETLLDAAETVLDRLGALIARLEDAEVHARAVIDELDGDQRQAAEVIADTTALVARVGVVVDDLPNADALTAAVRGASRLSEQVSEELLPVVRTLESVAPDLAELVTTSKALNEIIGAVPGLGRVKKRAEEASE
jgi:ABC-type transporter Mla subunit MlaD